MRRAALTAVVAAALMMTATALAATGQTPAPGQTPGPGKTPAPGWTPGFTPGFGPGSTPGPKGNRHPICVEKATLVVPKGSKPFPISGNCYSPTNEELHYTIGCGTCFPKHTSFIFAPGKKIVNVQIKPNDPNFEGEDFFSYVALVGDPHIPGDQSSSNVADVYVTVAEGAGSAEWVGGDGDDRLLGNGITDVMRGLEGEDLLDAGAGSDQLDGGLGDDNLLAGAGDDDILAGLGDDTAEGGVGDDEIDGLSGADTLEGGPGDDDLNGGPGADTLEGGAGDDVISDTSRGGSAQASAAAKKSNKVKSGAGADRVNVRNGVVDRVDCGAGRDTVKADKKDKVKKNCEKVKRKK